jgi:hypothetical protein
MVASDDSNLTSNSAIMGTDTQIPSFIRDTYYIYSSQARRKGLQGCINFKFRLMDQLGNNMGSN